MIWLLVISIIINIILFLATLGFAKAVRYYQSITNVGIDKL